MITLDSTSKSLEVVLAGAVSTTQPAVAVAYADIDDTAATITSAASDTATSDTTPVTVLAAPGAGVQRVLEYLSVFNADSASVSVTVQLNDSSTIRKLIKMTLATGETLQYTRGGGWANATSPFAAGVTVSGTVTANIGTSGSLALESGGNLATLAGTVSASKVAISAASLPLPTGAATEASLATLAGVVSSAKAAVKSADGDLATLGTTTDSAAAGDTTNTGLIGLFKRLLQRVTTLLAVFPTTLATNSGSKDASTLRVVLATDQVQLTNKLLVTPDANSAVNVGQWNGVAPSAAALLADAVALPTAPKVGAVGVSYNGSTLDLERGNEDMTVLASAARTATTTSANFTNYNGRGLVVSLNITAAPVTPGTGGLQLVVYGIDLLGNGASINATPTKLTAVQGSSYIVYPGATSGGNQATSCVVPRRFNIQVVHSDAQSYTYSVTACVVR